MKKEGKRVTHAATRTAKEIRREKDSTQGSRSE